MMHEYAEISYRKSWTNEELKKEKRTKWIHKYLPFLEKRLPKFFKGIYKKQCVITEDMNRDKTLRMIISKILSACNKIAVQGRRGSGNVVVTNCQLSVILQDSPAFMIKQVTDSTINIHNGMPYPIGTIQSITIFVDPYMRWDDTSVLVFKKPQEYEPSIYMPYMGAQSICTIAERTMAPRIALRYRCAPSFVGAENSADRYYEKIYFKLNKNLI